MYDPLSLNTCNALGYKIMYFAKKVCISAWILSRGSAPRILLKNISRNSVRTLFFSLSATNMFNSVQLGLQFSMRLQIISKHPHGSLTIHATVTGVACQREPQ